MGKWKNIRASLLALSAVALAGGSVIAAKPVATSQAENPAVDPGAKDALTRMSNYLKMLPAFGVRENVTREQVINSDLKVQKSYTADIVVRRPDRLKSEFVGDDDKNHSIFYDSKTLTVFMPLKNYYAQMAAPATIGETIDAAESQYGVEFPAPDFMKLISGEDFAAELKAAGNVGKSRVNGVECDHYAYRTPDVDYQIWIATGDKPLPHKLVITSKKLPSQPEYVAIFTWDPAPKTDDAAFAFTAPEGATKIPFGMPPAAANKAPAAANKAPAKK